MSELTLAWTVSDQGSWCNFDLVDLSGVDDFGVYVIWHEGDPGRIIRIGKGEIAARLAAHRSDLSICQFRKRGTLRVTWAAVPADLADGVERFLVGHLAPLVGDAARDVPLVAVNLP